MVEAEAVEDRRMQVAHVDGVLDDVVRELVGLAVDGPALDAGAGGPDAEIARVVVAAVVGLGQAALRVDRAAELAAPDDQRVVEHAALLQVLDQGPGGAVDVLALRLDVVGQVAVLVPAAVEDLHEAHAALDQAARREAAVGERPAVAGIRAVQVERRVGLLGEVGQLGHRGLHAEGHLILLEARGGLGVAGGLVGHLVELGEAVEHLAARGAAHAVGVAQVEHGVAGRAERHPGMLRGQEAGRPEAGRDRLHVGARVGVAGVQHDERRQVLVGATEAVGEPGAEGGLARDHVARVREHVRRLVVDRLGVHRPDDRDVIHHLGGVRQDLGHPGARLAMLLEGVGRRRHGEALLAGGHAGDALTVADRRGEVLVEAVRELRLVVEGLELRGRADHREVDAALGFGGEVDSRRQTRGGCARGESAADAAGEQRAEGDAAQAHRVLAEELPAVDAEVVFEGIEGLHGLIC